MEQAGKMEFRYVGSELDLFARARNWKSYWSGFIAPFIGTCVLEVGAGIGSTPRVLCSGRQTRWLCLEPDARLADRLRSEIVASRVPAACEVRTGTIAELPEGEKFDTILYVDVLEHIEDDRDELERASRFLLPNGKIIVLSPAHQWLYTPFDAALGHFRRYNAARLRSATPRTVKLEKLFYLDAIGLLASLGNRLILKSAHPTDAQIDLWDQWMVPISRRLDRIFRFSVGKSVIAVWTLSK
jgi:SAM-dependent methyltransferase